MKTNDFKYIAEVIKQSQDGKKEITETYNDPWNSFLFSCVVNNETTYAGECDIDKIKSDMRYGIDQFTKALNALEKEFPAEAETSAMLVASAPELLEALKRLSAKAIDWQDRQEAEAVIAKAEGR